jgi:hypothetical protein
LISARWIWLKGCLQAIVRIAVALRASRAVLRSCLALGFAMAAAGCSLGVTHLEEVHYIAVPSEDNVNYFRIRLEAYVTLSETKFEAGWFPAETVDIIYGNADEAGIADTYKVKNQVRAKYDAAILATAQGYLDAAANPNAKPEVLEAWLAAQRRVRATAGSDVALPPGAIEVEYDPASGLALRHAGEKLIFVLSSNPDEVFTELTNFSRDAQVGATVLQLSDVVRQRAANDVVETVARNEARAKLDALVVERIDVALQAVESASTVAALQKEIDTLRLIVETVR